MVTGMCRCRECGRWYFNWRRLFAHLIGKHGYKLELPDEEQDG